MTLNESSRSLVILNAPPRLEEALVDWLLEHRKDEGFTSFPVQGHSSRHNHLSIAEQVNGRQRRLQFQVELATDTVGEFLDTLHSSFASAGIHYWALPLSRYGRV